MPPPVGLVLTPRARPGPQQDNQLGEELPWIRRALRREYADAGIGHYWIVDVDASVSLTACHLAAGFGYQDPGAVTGVFATTEPFPVRLQLHQLL